MGSKILKSSSLIAVLCFLCLRYESALADDFDVVYQRLHESALSGASHEGYQAILDLLQSDGSFSDLKYGHDGSHSYRTHGRRQSALLYHHLQGEKDLKAEAELCFEYITYDAPQNPDDSWWGQVIGTPKMMWQGAVLADGILGQKLLYDFLDRYWVNTKIGPVWTTKEAGNNSGGNFGSRAFLGEMEGLLRGTYNQRHNEVAGMLHKELVEHNSYHRNGIRPDGCLQQHNPGEGDTEDQQYLDHILWNPYAGEYGKELTRPVGLMMTWFSGTDLDYADDTIEGLYSTYFDCQQWVFRGHVIEPTLCGRKIPKGDMITHYSAKGLIYDTGISLQKIGRHQEEVESALHRYDNVVPDPEYALEGHRHFFNSDLSVHQRREYYASVRILSNRTVRPESWRSGENIEGFFQADGFMTLLLDGEEYGERNNEVFQVYDWARVPSVTNQYTTDIPGFHSGTYHSRHFFNNAKFSGGVTDGSIGVASMVYNRPHVPLQAFKSWFFFDDVIVVLGSGITLDAEHVNSKYVGTTFTQIVFKGEYVICTEQGDEETLGMGISDYFKPSWLFHRDVGYVFLNGDEHVHATAETRSHGEKTIDVFMAWTTHTADPVDAKLAYAVLPATDLEATRKFSSNPTIKVITKNTNTHVVCHHPSMAVGASLMEGGKITVPSCGDAGELEIEVDIPCLLVATIEKAEGINNEATITVSVADPQQTYEAIDITVTFEGRQADKTTINLPKDPKRGSSATKTITV